MTSWADTGGWERAGGRRFSFRSGAATFGRTIWPEILPRWFRDMGMSGGRFGVNGGKPRLNSFDPGVCRKLTCGRAADNHPLFSRRTPPEPRQPSNYTAWRIIRGSFSEYQKDHTLEVEPSAIVGSVRAGSAMMRKGTRLVSP
jgi:hypothetical protein